MIDDDFLNMLRCPVDHRPLRVADAEVEIAQAAIKESQAALDNAEVELARTVIRAPMDGVVIRRNVDLGQTVAASLQAPTLFTIAQALHRMQAEANVDEADIGRVVAGQQVTFTVDAHPGRTFRGEVVQIRMAPEVFENVVTYTVIISADNSDLLLPIRVESVPKRPRTHSPRSSLPR